MDIKFDHAVLVAQNLVQGQNWWRTRFGFTLAAGGKHPAMGTHNLLTATGTDHFLEMIAVDPEGKKPTYPRWFNLDDLSQYQKAQNPFPVAWVVRTNNIYASVSAAHQAGFPVGHVTEMQRGDLKWLISVRSDGDLVEGGTFPVLIQWLNRDDHPACQMIDCQIRYQMIRLCHPDPEYLRRGLAAIGAESFVEILSAPEPCITLELVRQDVNYFLGTTR